MSDAPATRLEPTITVFSTVRSRGYWNRSLSVLRRDWVALGGGLIFLATFIAVILAPYLAPSDPLAVDPLRRLAPPGAAGHLLGSDELGRDVLSRLLWGGRNSLRAAAQPVAISLALGLALGLIAGFYAGLIDTLIMRVTDVFLAFPAVLLAIAVGAALGPGLNSAILAITFVSVPSLTRLARASTLVVREQLYVEAARSIGARSSRIILKHVLPNILPLAIVYATLDFGRMIIFSAALSFLGIGVQPPEADWGSMLARGRIVITVAPHVVTVPGLVIFLVTLGVNIFGDGLRDALDPQHGVRRK